MKWGKFICFITRKHKPVLYTHKDYPEDEYPKCERCGTWGVGERYHS